MIQQKWFFRADWTLLQLSGFLDSLQCSNQRRKSDGSTLEALNIIRYCAGEILVKCLQGSVDWCQNR